MSTVYITAGGTRFHWNRRCRALATGREIQSWRAGDWNGPGTGLYPLDGVSATAAAAQGFTACRVCVPPVLALPATGATHGHEPFGPYDGALICRRCYTEHRGRRRVVLWPCTSASVLGLVITDADRWNAAHPVGTPVHAWPWTRTDEPTVTRTSTPAWRLGHGASVVSVAGHTGGIALTHVEAL